MFIKRLAALVCSLQLFSPALALPGKQQPLSSHYSKGFQAVRAELKKAEIIPTVIDDFLPSLRLSVSWPKAHAKLGNTIKPKHLQKQPTITLHDETTSDMTYIIALTDPDAPSRDNPKWSEMCHWIATNLTSSSNTIPMPISESGPDDVMPYKPPGPPPKTGKHRYVFLVFAPRNGTSETLHPSKPGDRQHWGFGKEGKGVREWAGENGLVAVGAQFIYAENEKQ
ncbi:hypothetical protein HBI29_214760 [Parastagonospora nodorum]|nr:hypothetical protein HBI29_214760 [Parastagonospora nodorum]